MARMKVSGRPEACATRVAKSVKCFESHIGVSCRAWQFQEEKPRTIGEVPKAGRPRRRAEAPVRWRNGFLRPDQIRADRSSTVATGGYASYSSDRPARLTQTERK